MAGNINQFLGNLGAISQGSRDYDAYLQKQKMNQETIDYNQMVNDQMRQNMTNQDLQTKAKIDYYSNPVFNPPNIPPPPQGQSQPQGQQSGQSQPQGQPPQNPPMPGQASVPMIQPGQQGGYQNMPQQDMARPPMPQGQPQQQMQMVTPAMQQQKQMQQGGGMARQGMPQPQFQGQPPQQPMPPQIPRYQSMAGLQQQQQQAPQGIPKPPVSPAQAEQSKEQQAQVQAQSKIAQFMDYAKKTNMPPKQMVDELEMYQAQIEKDAAAKMAASKAALDQLKSQTEYNKSQVELNNAGMDPFMKEAAARYGKDTSEYQRAVEKHLNRLDSPTTTMINAGGGNDGSKGDWSHHGDDYLKTLPSKDQAMIKAIAEGRETPASIGRGKDRQKLMEEVNQYDPNYSETRFKTRQDFTSGATSKNVTSINTAIHHLGSLDIAADKLKNGDVKGINSVINDLANQFGVPAKNSFELTQIAVGDELMKTFRGSGASESEAEAWRKKFDSANSPESLKDAVRQGVELLSGRISEVNEQWKRGMGTPDGYPDLISKPAQKVIKKLGLKIDGLDQEVESSALTMPKSKDQLKTGAIYDTPRGKAKWNGKEFEAL